MPLSRFVGRADVLLVASCLAIAATAAHEGDHSGAEPFGRPGIAKNVARTLTITTTDTMRFDPASLAFTTGQTIRLHIVNAGKVPHEFVLGTRAEIDEHAAMMRKDPSMSHAEPNAVSVAPGASADLVWQFSVPGTFVYACLVPGHFEAGMQGRVTVTAKATTR